MSGTPQGLESLLDEIAEAWLASTAVTDYAMEIYGRAPIIVLGAYDANPPDDDCPLLAVTAVEIDHGDERPVVVYGVELTATVSDATVTEDKDSRIMKYRGFVTSATLLERAIEAIAAGRIGKTDYLSGIGVVPKHPLYDALCSVKITKFYGARRR